MKTFARSKLAAAHRRRARRTLRGFGALALVAGFLFVPLDAYSRKSAKGTVTTRSRRTGVALAGSKVDLVVSRGRRP